MQIKALSAFESPLVCMVKHVVFTHKLNGSQQMQGSTADNSLHTRQMHALEALKF